MKSLIEKFTAISSPSGYESPIREAIRAAIEPYVDEARVDALGNLIALKGPSKASRKIMLAAHMDEIGVIASHIDENGFVRFLPTGGVRPYTLIGGRVRFLNGQTGVIHCERIEDPGKMPEMEKMFIDLGVSSRQDCPVQVGDVA